MTISWFPGHMNKMRKEIKRQARDTRAVLELLDARAPLAFANPLLADLFKGIPRLCILTKPDLADAEITRRWQHHLQSVGNGYGACLINNPASPLDNDKISRALIRLIPDLPAAGRVQVLITGVPNVGKSTLLNQIAGRPIANTGNEPAVTKQLQRHVLNDAFVLVDTPGMMWPKLADERQAYLLAILGTIRNTAVDQDDIAWFAAEELLTRHKTQVSARFPEFELQSQPEALLEHIAVKRGCLVKGGRPDLYRAGELLLNDLRSGKLGAFSLESPPE